MIIRDRVRLDARLASSQMTGFLLKKLVAPLFLPVPLCVLLLTAGLLLLWFSRRQRMGKVLVTAAAVLLLLLSNTSISEALLKPLETRYPPLLTVSSLPATPTYIVVLGGGSSPNPALPPTSQLGGVTLSRLVEAVRLHRQLPASRLIVSGGTLVNAAPEAVTMAAAAIALGVPPEDILKESRSRDTEDEARLIAPMVGAAPLLLVTSAAHMPRAMVLFRHFGMHPTAAPTDYWAARAVGAEPGEFFPRAGGLLRTESAFHEYLGAVWAMLHGRH
mgnify:CR=1 FL=1